MQKRTGWMTILMMAGLASMSFAQELPAARGASGRGTYGFVATLDHRVGLSPEQKDAVKGLLAEQREKSQSLRQNTDQKIRGLLNADQQKKFDEMLAQQKARRAAKK